MTLVTGRPSRVHPSACARLPLTWPGSKRCSAGGRVRRRRSNRLRRVSNHTLFVRSVTLAGLASAACTQPPSPSLCSRPTAAQRADSDWRGGQRRGTGGGRRPWPRATGGEGREGEGESTVNQLPVHRQASVVCQLELRHVRCGGETGGQQRGTGRGGENSTPLLKETKK